MILGRGVRVLFEGLRHPEGCMTYLSPSTLSKTQTNQKSVQFHLEYRSKTTLTAGIIPNERTCIKYNSRGRLYRSLKIKTTERRLEDTEYLTYSPPRFSAPS